MKAGLGLFLSQGGGSFRLITLSTPVVTTLTWASSAAPGAVLSTVTGLSGSGTPVLIGGAGQIELVGSNIVKGAVPFTGSSSFSIRVSDPDAGNNDAGVPYKQTSFSYTVTEASPAVVQWDIARSPEPDGSPDTIWALTESGLKATPVTGASNRKAIQISSEIGPGEKRRFGIYVNDVGFGRASFGLAIKNLFNPVTAGSFDNLADSANGAAYFPHDETVRTGGSTFATLPNNGVVPGMYFIDVDTVASPPKWYITAPSGVGTWFARSAALALPAAATGGAVVIPTFVSSQDNVNCWARIDNAEASWPPALAAVTGYSPLVGFGSGGSAVVTATTYAQITNAMGNGAIIEVAPGAYQELVLSGLTFSPPCTIRAQNSANKPTFAGGIASSCTGIILQNLDFNALRSGAARATTAAGQIFSVQYCGSITLSGCEIRHAPSEATEPVLNQVTSPYGIYARDSTSLNVIGCHIRWTGGGINMVNMTGALISGNHIHHMYSDDFIGASRSTNVIIEDNLFHDGFFQLTSPDAHQDLFQVQTVNDTQAYGPYIYRRNRYYMGSVLPSGAKPQPAQGCFISSEGKLNDGAIPIFGSDPPAYLDSDYTHYPKVGVEVYDNEHWGTQTNSFAISHATSPKMYNNITIGFKDIPGFPAGNYRTGHFWENVTNILVHDNVAPEITNLGGSTTDPASVSGTLNAYVTSFYGPPPGW